VSSLTAALLLDRDAAKSHSPEHSASQARPHTDTCLCGIVPAQSQLRPVSGYSCSSATVQCLYTSLDARSYQASVLKAGSTQRCTSASTQRSASIQRPQQCALLIGRLPLWPRFFCLLFQNRTTL